MDDTVNKGRNLVFPTRNQPRSKLHRAKTLDNRIKTLHHLIHRRSLSGVILDHVFDQWSQKSQAVEPIEYDTINLVRIVSVVGVVKH